MILFIYLQGVQHSPETMEDLTNVILKKIKHINSLPKRWLIYAHLFHALPKPKLDLITTLYYSTLRLIDIHTFASSFKFLKMWTLHKDRKQLISNCWNVNIRGTCFLLTLLCMISCLRRKSSRPALKIILTICSLWCLLVKRSRLCLAWIVMDPLTLMDLVPASFIPIGRLFKKRSLMLCLNSFILAGYFQTTMPILLFWFQCGYCWTV